MSMNTVGSGASPGSKTPAGGPAGAVKQNRTDEIAASLSLVRFDQLTPEQQSILRDFQLKALGDIEKVQEGPGSLPRVDYEALLREQDPEAYRAYRRLPPSDQQIFLRLAAEAPRPTLRVLGAEISTPLLSPDLLVLLKSGKFEERDSTGQSLAQVLGRLLEQEMAEGLDRQQILGELLGQLANPGRINQGYRGTCAPTTIQHQLASEAPAEYARLVVGLTSECGSVRMRNGDLLVRDQGTTQTDNSGRSAVCRIFQAALMEYANGPDKDYDNETDVHTDQDGNTNRGMPLAEMERALEALHGQDFETHSVSDLQRAEEHLLRLLSGGQTVPVAIRWNAPGQEVSGHALLLESISGNRVVLRNPWGAGDRGQGDPPREVLDNNGWIEMDKAEFFSRIYAYFAPKESTSVLDFFKGFRPNVRLDSFRPLRRG